MTKVDELLAQTREAGERLDEVRTDAVDGAVMALRELETKVQEALGEDTLRGMVDLVPGASERCYGAQLSAKKYGVDTELPDDGREVLCMNKAGCVVWMRRISTPAAWGARPLKDDEIRAEFLEPATRAVQTILERHLARTARTHANYEAVAQLSAKLAGAIGFKL